MRYILSWASWPLLYSETYSTSLSLILGKTTVTKDYFYLGLIQVNDGLQDSIFLGC